MVGGIIKMCVQHSAVSQGVVRTRGSICTHFHIHCKYNCVSAIFAQSMLLCNISKLSLKTILVSVYSFVRAALYCGRRKNCIGFI